ncbi:ferrous iron transport protein B [Oleidesulfovibrio alaskensis]|jgi:ferrous iron transport protein B|uniref:ferrous iron transport protein B n=1 Tax=Oleidesulfovibrio alaskensis TaxID=58180 RepID=UPI001A46D1DC|nr:ferrous iron transport protein B [Oleidesulfovibrio alaskensis]MBL3582312.1 ferrous iron transport protein B [Oleidesulfovibrio alaskensis]
MSAGTHVVALAGQPNTGKSTIFNALTGMYQEVGNWAGKTVEKRTGQASRQDGGYAVIDLPGTYSLDALSQEERIAADFIKNYSPDVTVVVASAVSPQRTLHYALDVIMLQKPMVLVMNMADIARGNSQHLDVENISQKTGVPVLLLSASRKQELGQLKQAIAQALKVPPVPKHIVPELASGLPEGLKRSFTALVQQVCDVSGFTRMRSEILVWKAMEGGEEERDILRSTVGEDAAWVQNDLIVQPYVQQARYGWLEEALGTGSTAPASSKTVSYDRWLLHPFAGALAMAGILLLSIIVGFGLGFPLALKIGQTSQALETIASAGIPQDMIVTKALFTGTWRGVGAVLSMLPFIMVFYAVFAVLEDIGYMARAAFIMDRAMTRIGLNGKVFIPLLFSMPCNITGIMGCRTIDDQRMRKLAVLLVPLVPCAAKLIVLVSLASWLFPPLQALAVVFSLISLNMLILGGCSLVFGRFIPRQSSISGLLMELPHYHRPNIRTISRQVFRNTLAFLKKASTLIVSFSVIVWFVSYYPGGSIETSLMGQLGKYLTPLGAPMGADWRLITSLLASCISKEAVLATMGVIYNTPIGALPATLKATVSPLSAIAFMCAQSLFIPCIATLGMMYNETGSYRTLAVVISYTILLPFIVATAVFQIGSMVAATY